MKNIKTFKEFVNESELINEESWQDRYSWDNRMDLIEIGFSGEGYIDKSKQEITITYHEGDWDNSRRFIKDLKLLANHSNDIMSNEIDDALNGSGWEIDYSKKGKVSNNEVTLKLKKS